MSFIKRIREQGLSLKFTSTLMLIVSLVITAVLLYSTTKAFEGFREMEKSTDDYIALQEAASELMTASDYLTEQVQSYAVMGDREYLDNYFEEADVTQRRQEAIATMEAKIPSSPALRKLMDGMYESESLMNIEYYAMRLVLLAQGDTNMPAVLANTTISEEDLALSPQEQIELARNLVHNEEYNARKERIRSNMAACIEELKNSTHGNQQEMESLARNGLVTMAVLIVVQSVAIFSMLWLTTHLGIRPVLRAVDHIKMDQSLPVIGASEFRYLAGTYNVMYAAYKKSIAHLNFKASHDELTGVYNRAGYELIKESLDMTSTAFMVIDADNFKNINDTYGHEMGDEVIKRIANTLKKHFRSDDYVCRIGGDEFVVFMVHVPEQPRVLIERKIAEINKELSVTDGDVPPISLSVGIAYSENGGEPSEIFRQADAALYHVKSNGRQGSCFYTEGLELQ
ncbi:MAG: GGDEF domain-containing protein [Clostridiales bacterium]|nr:GGDEF domain-containing protein [Clostridiales bacterium]